MQITKTLLFSHGTKITAHAVELAVTTTDAQPWPTQGTEWEVKSRWTTAEEAEDAARKLIADEADALRRDGLTAVVSDGGLSVAWVDGETTHRRHAARVRETTVRVPTGTPTTRLARLAIELSGETPPPASLAALEAAERGDVTIEHVIAAHAAADEARGWLAQDTARACAGAASHALRGGDDFAQSIADVALNAVLHRGLRASKEAVLALDDGPWTEAKADAERAPLQAIRLAMRDATVRVREILPDYEPDEDARRWLAEPAAED